MSACTNSCSCELLVDVGVWSRSSLLIFLEFANADNCEFNIVLCLGVVDVVVVAAYK